jgi:hypothetical protein
MIGPVNHRPDAAFLKNCTYFFKRLTRKQSQPKMNKKPPMGVRIPTAVGTDLFMAYRETIR